MLGVKLRRIKICRNHDFVVLQEARFKRRIKTTDSRFIRECNVYFRSARAKLLNHLS